MRRSLSLRKETLVDLTPTDLETIRGASGGMICISDNSCSICTVTIEVKQTV